MREIPRKLVAYVATLGGEGQADEAQQRDGGGLGDRGGEDTFGAIGEPQFEGQDADIIKAAGAEVDGADFSQLGKSSAGDREEVALADDELGGTLDEGEEGRVVVKGHRRTARSGAEEGSEGDIAYVVERNSVSEERTEFCSVCLLYTSDAADE